MPRGICTFVPLYRLLLQSQWKCWLPELTAHSSFFLRLDCAVTWHIFLKFQVLTEVKSAWPLCHQAGNINPLLLLTLVCAASQTVYSRVCQILAYRPTTSHRQTRTHVHKHIQTYIHTRIIPSILNKTPGRWLLAESTPRARAKGREGWDWIGGTSDVTSDPGCSRTCLQVAATYRIYFLVASHTSVGSFGGHWCWWAWEAPYFRYFVSPVTPEHHAETAILRFITVVKCNGYKLLYLPRFVSFSAFRWTARWVLFAVLLCHTYKQELNARQGSMLRNIFIFFKIIFISLRLTSSLKKSKGGCNICQAWCSMQPLLKDTLGDTKYFLWHRFVCDKPRCRSQSWQAMPE